MRLAEDVADLGTIEQRPSLDGRNMTMVMNPLKAKERKPETEKKPPQGKNSRRAQVAEEKAAEAAEEKGAEPAEEKAAEEKPAEAATPKSEQEPASADAG
jgi:translation initiation factor IF-3